jgi:hypothetical protein
MSSFDLSRVILSKLAYRKHVASRPLEEKLHLLDELCERALAIRRSIRPAPAPAASTQVNESSAPYADEPSVRYRPD